MPKKTSTTIPTGILARTSRILMSGARIASRELSERLNASGDGGLAMRLKQTQDLVTTLSHLKGAAMKAGQFISLEFGDLLPPPIVQVLQQLHDDSAAMPFTTVRRILLQEWGEARFAAVTDLAEQPFASASIGQVHRARLLGRDVVIKVQFPGVSDTIGSDLAVLRRTIAAFLTVKGKNIELGPLFEELARNLTQETDYLSEAAALINYRKALSGADYAVPEVFTDYCTRLVLTMSFESGTKLSDWLKAQPGPQPVAHFADQVLQLLLLEFFAFGMVQTDPNYGNFLYRPIDRQLVLLDLGALNRYEKPFRAAIRELVLAASAGDEAQLLALTQTFGLLDKREPPKAVEAYLALMRLVGRLFDPTQQPFSFADEDYLKTIRAAGLNFMQEVQYSAPAKQIIFLNRKLGGMFHILKDARASVDLSLWLERVRGLDLGPIRPLA